MQITCAILLVLSQLHFISVRCFVVNLSPCASTNFHFSNAGLIPPSRFCTSRDTSSSKSFQQPHFPGFRRFSASARLARQSELDGGDEGGDDDDDMEITTYLSCPKCMADHFILRDVLGEGRREHLSSPNQLFAVGS